MHKKVKNSVKIKINTENNNNSIEIKKIVKNKISYIQEIIINTILSIQIYKKNEIFSNSDIIVCINSLNELYEITELILLSDNNIDKIIDSLQETIDKLSIIIGNFGTKKFEDLLYITFGSEFLNFDKGAILNSKFELIKKYVYPIGFKILSSRQNRKKDDTIQFCISKISEDVIDIETSPLLECFDYDINTKSFYNKTYGIKVILHSDTNKTIIINGLIENINLNLFYNNNYINLRKNQIFNNDSINIIDDIIKRQFDCMTLKDILIYSNEDIYKKNASIISLVNTTKKSDLNTTVNKFLLLDTFNKRNMLIELLIYNKDPEIQYITYLLYDLITMKTNNGIDSNEQIVIYDSFPWKIKLFFKDAMKNTMKFTQDCIQKYDTNQITLEQQIYVLKVPEQVKEKAISKFKEIKGKSDDSCIKAKQYLEGLLRIPFNSYKREPILNMISTINDNFKHLIPNIRSQNINIIDKPRYANVEIHKYIKEYEIEYCKFLEKCNLSFKKLSKIQYESIINYITNNYPEFANRIKDLPKKNKINEINQILKTGNDIYQRLKIYDIIEQKNALNSESYYAIQNINIQLQDVNDEIDKISETLDDSIYGHSYAKKQLMKIICQWISGEPTGYCFGFEGSPGVGKTSLAKKGLAKCLKDLNGDTRPFAFIALGGSCNGSTLEGHGYTYVNSSWGRIVDILMDSKCMNPIIYIDELDKVSKSENGKEIIGILTHLIDSTQNDCFQDKYYSGINLDLSKALFIFSYNDPDQIDPILLDRIHRIKFDNLLLQEKMVIVKKHIMPEINKKMGFCDLVQLSDEVITTIIQNYTMEPGVRKLKEILFDLYGCLNIELLKSSYTNQEFPIIITNQNLEENYLKKYKKITDKKIHKIDKIGIINGLWANSFGNGGIIPIEVVFFPSNTLLELKLTGMQGDIMKESMNVAKTLAWNLCSQEIKDKIFKEYENNKKNGIHIHCPEGAVSKDGPSAGVAITLAIYSILNDIPIKNDIAITGEIDLQGNILPIGGLDVKILGGIRAGIRTIIYPSKNNSEYLDFVEKHGEYPDIKFIEASNIHEVLTYVFV
jgi:ATP-dependent Lon protease